MTAKSDKIYYQPREIPLFVGALIFAAGTLMAWQVEVNPLIWLLALLAAGFSLTMMRRSHLVMQYLQALVLLLTSAAATSTYKQSTSSTLFKKSELVKVINVEPYSKGVRLTVTPRNSWTVYNPKSIIYLRTDSIHPLPGDIIGLPCTLEPIQPARYPFEFDAKRYWMAKGVTLQGFADIADLTSWHKNDSWNLRKISLLTNRKWASLFDQIFNEANTRALVKAMVLGDKSHLQEDRLAIYKRTGVMHVLAISGLHIGIVASLLMLIFGRPTPTVSKRINVLRISTICSLLWFYVLVSGLAPSACRAALMFTIYLAGRVINRHASTLNVIGFTAIIYIAIQPYILFNLSFQFSFAALLGIILWGIPLNRVLPLKHKISKYIWSIISISVGAQIMLLPLLMYYFGTVSIISPVSSIIAIPFAFLLVSGAFIATLGGLIQPEIGIAVADLMTVLSSAFNRTTTALSTVPFADITLGQLRLDVLLPLCALIILMTARLHSDRIYLELLCYPVTALLVAMCYYHYARTYSSEEVVVTQYSSSPPAFDIYYNQTCVSSVNPSVHDKWVLNASSRNFNLHSCQERKAIDITGAHLGICRSDDTYVVIPVLHDNLRLPHQIKISHQ